MKTETAFRDTTVTLMRPAYTDTVQLSPWKPGVRLSDIVMPPERSGGGEVKAGTGRHGVRVELEGDRAIVSVPKDTLSKEIRVKGESKIAELRELSFIERMLDDVPFWAVITALLLAAALLIYAIKR